jgi:hypothetical protein
MKDLMNLSVYIVLNMKYICVCVLVGNYFWFIGGIVNCEYVV